MRNNLRGFAIIFAIIIVGFVVLLYVLLTRTNKKAIVQPILENVNKAVSLSSPTPTPFAFQELTIPYLRSRTYESTLGELQKVSENSSYTSYVTSYNSDGLKIYGLLTQPKGNKPTGGWPAIVFVHGYIPPESYQTK